LNIVNFTAVMVAMLSVFAMLFGAYFTLDEMHASNKKVTGVEIELRQEILDRDIKKDAEARVYYKDKAREGDLDKADEARLEYLEEQLERKYEEQQMYEQKSMELR